MKRYNKVTGAGDLYTGDRFYFPTDKSKKVWEVEKISMGGIVVKREKKQKKIQADTEVIFLRSAASVEQ